MEKKIVLNKSQKMKVCKYILDHTKDVVEKKHSDFLMKEVFPFHSEWKEKMGVGVDHIEVRDARAGYRCFYIIRTDGTETDISYRASLTPHSKMDDIRAACRTAIAGSIELCRSMVVFPYTCPVTGDIVTDKSDIHIDHYDPTFKELVDEWMEDRDVDTVYKHTLKSNTDGSLYTYFDDPALTMDFICFHTAKAHLRAVSKRANLSVLKKKH